MPAGERPFGQFFAYSVQNEDLIGSILLIGLRVAIKAL